MEGLENRDTPDKAVPLFLDQMSSPGVDQLFEIKADIQSQWKLISVQVLVYYDMSPLRDCCEWDVVSEDAASNPNYTLQLSVGASIILV